MTAKTQIWINLVRAEVCAHVHDATNFYQAMDDAERIADNAQTKDDPYWTGFDKSMLAGYRGACFIHLNQPIQALAILEKALSLLNPLYQRRRSILLTDIATAYALQGEIEESCQRASEALAINAHTNSPTNLKRVQSFRQKLEPWKTVPSVQELDEQLLFA
jgi:tetratricopeptide (TPR) repeat protein